jgi:sugar (pentulose or hexulose) kinase
VRAVVEGVTFGLRYAVDALRRTGVEPTEITLVGGGAGSDGWAQLCADVFDVPVRRPPQTEAAALGAALQARWVVDGAPPPTAARDVPRWEPRSDSALEAARARLDHLRQLAMAAGV